MSYRELRDFVEIMKALGFKQLISVENFRVPNFYLMADVLFWLVHRYDDTAELSSNISTVDLRVSFLKAVAQFMATKAQVKLNIKQLYRADGYAVKELLKICRILYNAVEAHPSELQQANSVNTVDKLEELKEAKTLAREIVESGGKLSNLLAHEEKLKKSRDRALKFLDSISLNLDRDSHDQIERNIRQELNLVSERITEYSKLIGDLEADEKTLKVKIEKKKRALIGYEKRLRSLKKVRPDYMEEYEQLEAELKLLHEAYLERFRNLHYLESELDNHHKQDMARKEEADRQLKRMQRRWRASEERQNNGDATLDDLWSDDEKDGGGRGGRASRPGGRSQAPRTRGPALDATDSEEDEESDEEDLDDDSRPMMGKKPSGRVSGDEEEYDEEDESDYDEEEDEDESVYDEEDEESAGDDGYV